MSARAVASDGGEDRLAETARVTAPRRARTYAALALVVAGVEGVGVDVEPPPSVPPDPCAAVSDLSLEDSVLVSAFDFGSVLDSLLEALDEPYPSAYQPPPFKMNPAPLLICRFAVARAASWALLDRDLRRSFARTPKRCRRRCRYSRRSAWRFGFFSNSRSEREGWSRRSFKFAGKVDPAPRWEDRWMPPVMVAASACQALVYGPLLKIPQAKGGPLIFLARRSVRR